MSLQLTLADARALHLAAQGLAAPARRKATKADVLATIRRMALLQIDTISVVARSPYFVLWSRLGDYETTWLDELLRDGALFEYWAHEACFVPIEDFALLRHRMHDPASMGWKYSVAWMREHRREINQLKKHIRAHGPVRSADFARDDNRKGNGWWDWKPHKRHLEVLFTAGELMVAERRNFQRVYDLTERVLPDWNEREHAISPARAQATIIANTCRALGVVRADWANDYYRLRNVKPAPLLAALVDDGALVPARVAGWTHDVFVDAALVAWLDRASGVNSSVTTLLSPFDPVVWDRKRVSALFDFDYRIECYTPAPKRVHGYFVLPLLSRGRLVGRLDAKAYRKDGIFEVKALYLEDKVRSSHRLDADVSAAIRRCAAWHGTPTVAVTHSALPLAALRKGTKKTSAATLQGASKNRRERLEDKAHGAQQPRHINTIGEAASTARRKTRQ